MNVSVLVFAFASVPALVRVGVFVSVIVFVSSPAVVSVFACLCCARV